MIIVLTTNMDHRKIHNVRQGSARPVPHHKTVHAEDEEALLEAANHPEDAIRGEARAAYLAIDVAVGFPHNCVICHKLCGPHNHAAFAVILPGLLGDDPRTGIAGAVCTSCRPSISDEELRRMASEQACDILDLFRPAKGCDPANVWNRRPRS